MEAFDASSHKATETGKVRRRASTEVLGKGATELTSRWSEVPRVRLCPSGESNKAMARRGPDSRMVPESYGEQEGFEVSQAANMPVVERRGSRHDPCHASVANGVDKVVLTWKTEESCEANARCQGSDVGQKDELFLDISSHSRTSEPQVTFGKFRLITPVSLQVNHVFIDGAALGRLYQRAAEVMASPGNACSPSR